MNLENLTDGQCKSALNFLIGYLEALSDDNDLSSYTLEKAFAAARNFAENS